MSVTVRMDRPVKAAIASIADDAWTTIEYTDAIFDETTGDVDLPGRGRRDPVHRVRRARRRPTRCPAGWSCAASPTSTPKRRRPPGRTPCSTCGGSTRSSPPPTADALDTVAADKTHRGHAIIEQVHADLKNSALAHLPSGKFTANAAWLVLAVIAFNLTRAAATLTAAPELAKATTATVRRKLIHVPARVASSARRITLHLPEAWPWQTAWTRLFDRVADPPATATVLTTQPQAARPEEPGVEHPDSEVGRSRTPPPPPQPETTINATPQPIGGSRLSRETYPG